jgi:hypothetical protein
MIPGGDCFNATSWSASISSGVGEKQRIGIASDAAPISHRKGPIRTRSLAVGG